MRRRTSSDAAPVHNNVTIGRPIDNELFTYYIVLLLDQDVDELSQP